MPPRTIARSCFAACVLGLLLTTEAAAQTDPANYPAAPREELSAFDRFLGRRAVSGSFSGIHFVGVTEVRPITKGWYIEWTNDVVGAGIQRELNTIMGYDRRQKRYRIWRFETTDRFEDLEDGLITFVGDTLVQRWNRTNRDGKGYAIENRMTAIRDTLRMASFVVDTAGVRRLVGDVSGPRPGVARP